MKGGRRNATLVLLPCALFCLAANARADGDWTRRPLEAKRLQGTPPVIDGDLSDAVWKEAPPAEAFVDRQTGRAAPDQTTAYLLYDDQYLYAGFYCRDSQPSGITGREVIPDSRFQNDADATEDWVDIRLDPFQTNRWDEISVFSINPLGTRSAKIGGGRARKQEWQGLWEGAARRVPDGWTAEMRIPWKGISYPNRKDALTMGINFFRFQYRTQTQSNWSDVGPQFLNENQGRWTGVIVPQQIFRPALSLLPYALTEANRKNVRTEIGLDARYTVRPELNAVATLNPDFANVEGAIQGIQFSRAELFVPERRPFFLEGENYFEAGADYKTGSFFYPRRIDDFDVGGKIYGKITPKDTLGALQTIGRGGSNDTVLRWRHDWSPTSNYGVFFTRKGVGSLSTEDRLEAKNATGRFPEDNSVVAFVSDTRVGKAGLTFSHARSNGAGTTGDATEATLYYSGRHNFTEFGVQDVSPRYANANGFVLFNDYKGFYLWNSYESEWRQGPWRKAQVFLEQRYDFHQDGRPFRRGGYTDWSWERRDDWRVGFAANYAHFDRSLDKTLTFSVTKGVTNRFRQWGLSLTTGSLGGGEEPRQSYTYLAPNFSVRVPGPVDVAYSGSLVRLSGYTQQHIVTLTWTISPLQSLGGRVATRNGDVNAYLSYRFSGGRGTETYFILGDPNALTFTKRAVLKFVFVR